VPVPEVNNDESSIGFVSLPSNCHTPGPIKKFITTLGTGGNNEDDVVRILINIVTVQVQQNEINVSD